MGQGAAFWSGLTGVLILLSVGSGALIGGGTSFGKALLSEPTVGADTYIYPTPTIPRPPSRFGALAQTAFSPIPTPSPRVVTAEPVATKAAAANPAPTPTSRALPAGNGLRVGLQVGHWATEELPDELASLRTSTGAEGPGYRERDVNLNVATRAAKILEASGHKVDVLPSTIPVNYRADVFLSLHCDSTGTPSRRGFKLARGSRSAIPAVDDALVATVYRVYSRITGLPLDDRNVTDNMRFYYAFAGSNIKHAITANTAGAILEMGILTNTEDRRLLLGSPDLIAQGIAASVTEFLANQPRVP